MEEASFVHSEPPQDGSAPPVVSSDMEVLHDKVKKQVIKEGHGKRPLKFATCFGEYWFVFYSIIFISRLCLFALFPPHNNLGQHI